MPLPHRSSPRRRDRRSRSRSHSPRRRRSNSRSRDRRKSRSPQRRRSPERKYRSPPRRKSPSPRRRSRSPKRRSRSPKRRSRSHSPRRRSRSQSPRRKGHSPRRSPSPVERNHPVKRPADSSGKRSGFRSRTPSPSPTKRSRDERLYEDDVPYKLQQQQQRRPSKQARSPVQDSQYGGKMYADQPSSSKQPLFPSGSSKRSTEIDYVTIVEKGPRKQMLNKRFETEEQAAQGRFEFEENITIGIHRGPQHIELDDDDDIEVNYDFNPKTFKMLFPKKNYVKEIFDRDEIKIFHHDDILDEEAYVEKRTISIKPVDKPKSRKHDDELDYKITVGSSREGYGDRRMVQDSGSRSRHSRSGLYDDVPVTVRLDPKPDPRYEKIYRDQQRYEDLSLMQETVHRNPNDLRYNLMRRKSDGDRDGGRDDRERQSGQSAMMDARSRIEARRQGNRDDYDDRRDRSGDRRASHGSPSRRIERKRANVKTDLPDFKNRPGVKLEKPIVWVIGSSVVKDLKQFAEVFPDHNIWAQLKDDVTSLVVHGELDMKMEDILPAVKYLLKNNSPPQMIVLQCGELNVGVGRNVDVIDVVKKDLATIKELIPGVVMVWSQILPPWMVKDLCGNTLAKSRRRINTFMMKCFVSDEVGGCFLYHNMLRTDLIAKYHLPTSDGFLHLKKSGMQVYIYQLKAGIKYLITGHGSIFPYLQWPLKKGKIDEFEPQLMCMLNEEHIHSLDADRLSMFTKEQRQMLSNDQILMFHIEQLPFVFCEDFVQKLSLKQLSCMTKENFRHLTGLQMKLFTEVEERVESLSEEVVKYLNKRIAKASGKGKKKSKTEQEGENAETDSEKRESTLGDLMGSSESDEDDKSSVDSDRDWMVDNRILAPLSVPEDRGGWQPRGRSSWRGGRPFRGRGWGRGRGRGRGWNKVFNDKFHWHKGMERNERTNESAYSEHGMGRSRSRSRDRHDRYRSNSREDHDRYRSNSREGRGRYRSNSREGRGRYMSNSREDHDRYRSNSREGRERYRSKSREGRGRSNSRDRYRSKRRRDHGRSSSHDRYRSSSSESHSRSRSREKSRRSRSRHQSEKRHSRKEHSSHPAQTMPLPGQYPVGMMPQYGIPPVPFSPIPFPGMPMPPVPFPPFPGSWPGYSMPVRPPVPQPPGGQPLAPGTVQEKNWGESPSPNVSSINTSNLTQIN